MFFQKNVQGQNLRDRFSLNGFLFQKFLSRVTPRPPLRGVLVRANTTLLKLFWKKLAKIKQTSKNENIYKREKFVLKIAQVPSNKRTKIYVTCQKKYEIWFQKSFFPQKWNFFFKTVKQFPKNFKKKSNFFSKKCTRPKCSRQVQLERLPFLIIF